MADIPQLNFRIANQKLSRGDRFYVVADSVNYLNASFQFSSDWATTTIDTAGETISVPLARNAYFVVPGALFEQSISTAAPFSGVCSVPWEAIKAPGFQIWVEGQSLAGEKITTNIVDVEVRPTGIAATLTEQRQPTVTVQAQLDNLKAEVLDIANRALSATQTLQAAAPVVPRFTIGSVTTLSAGASASVELTGTPEAPILHFGIPQGPQGVSGSSTSSDPIQDFVNRARP